VHDPANGAAPHVAGRFSGDVVLLLDISEECIPYRLDRFWWLYLSDDMLETERDWTIGKHAIENRIDTNARCALLPRAGIRSVGK
jgi:hypothetical protein